MKWLLLHMAIAAAGLILDVCVSHGQEAPPVPASPAQPSPAQPPPAQPPPIPAVQITDDSPDADRPEWEIKFRDNLQPNEYARELDFFGIELAAIGKNGQIQYASQLSKAKPVRRMGAAADEHRTNTTWKFGTLATLDAKLLAKAGIATKDRIIAHYYPDAVTRELAALERAFAQREQRNILRTRFRVRPKADNDHEYEFVVEEQDPRITSSHG